MKLFYTIISRNFSNWGLNSDINIFIIQIYSKFILSLYFVPFFLFIQIYSKFILTLYFVPFFLFGGRNKTKCFFRNNKNSFLKRDNKKFEFSPKLGSCPNQTVISGRTIKTFVLSLDNKEFWLSLRQTYSAVPVKPINGRLSQRNMFLNNDNKKFWSVLAIKSFLCPS